MRYIFLPPALAGLLFAAVGAAADTLFKPGASNGSGWSVIERQEDSSKLTIGALSADGSKELQFVFVEIALDPELFVKFYDVPAETCGQMTMSVPDPNEGIGVNGTSFLAKKDCREGYMGYSINGVDGTHVIGELLLAGEDVTITFNFDGELNRQSWKAEGFSALARKRIEEYEANYNYLGRRLQQ